MSSPLEAQPILQEIRRIIAEEVPAAGPTIAYQMPAFRDTRIFIYFAAFKKHIGIYPPVITNGELEKALLPYRGEKGNLKFPLNQPMPYDLIRAVVAALSRQHANR